MKRRRGFWLLLSFRAAVESPRAEKSRRPIQQSPGALEEGTAPAIVTLSLSKGPRAKRSAANSAASTTASMCDAAPGQVRFARGWFYSGRCSVERHRKRVISAGDAGACAVEGSRNYQPRGDLSSRARRRLAEVGCLLALNGSPVTFPGREPTRAPAAVAGAEPAAPARSHTPAR